MSWDGKTYTRPLNTCADGSAENAPEMSGFSANAGIASEVANTAMQMVLLSFMVGALLIEGDYCREIVTVPVAVDLGKSLLPLLASEAAIAVEGLCSRFRRKRHAASRRS